MPAHDPYKGEPLRKQYIADLMCFGQIIAELKACDRLTGADEAQILNYMKATGKGWVCSSILEAPVSSNGRDM